MFSPFDGKNKPLLNGGYYYHSNYKDTDSPGEGACVRAQGQGLRAGSSHDRLVSGRAGWKVLPHGEAVQAVVWGLAWGDGEAEAYGRDVLGTQPHRPSSRLLGARGARHPHAVLAVSTVLCPDACEEHCPQQFLC